MSNRRRKKLNQRNLRKQSPRQEHGEEFADTGFFVSQHSDPEEGNTEEDTDEESSNGNSEDEDGS